MRMRTLKRPKRTSKAQVSTLVQTKRRSEICEAHRAYAASYLTRNMLRNQQQAIVNKRRVLGFTNPA